VTTPDHVLNDVITAGVSEARTGVKHTDTWGLRLATVTTAGDSTVIAVFDGDGFTGVKSVPIPMISLAGYIPVGARVAVISVPPSGNYIIQRIYGPADTEWVDYSPALTSSGVTPSVGAGSVTGRWRPVGHLMIEVEVLTSWGAGLSPGTGTYFWSSPFDPSDRSVGVSTGPCHIGDVGTADRTGIVAFFPASTVYYVAASPNITLGAGTPQVWAAGDFIKFGIFHEIVSFS
jgi:hypothetical protein